MSPAWARPGAGKLLPGRVWPEWPASSKKTAPRAILLGSRTVAPGGCGRGEHISWHSNDYWVFYKLIASKAFQPKISQLTYKSWMGRPTVLASGLLPILVAKSCYDEVCAGVLTQPPQEVKALLRLLRASLDFECTWHCLVREASQGMESGDGAGYRTDIFSITSTTRTSL